MAKVRQILKHVSVEIAKGSRRCRRNRNHAILAGEPCLVIRDDAGPWSRNYCRECALPILKLCAADLRGFRDVLYPERMKQARVVHRETVAPDATAMRQDVERIVGRPMNVTLYLPNKESNSPADVETEQKR